MLAKVGLEQLVPWTGSISPLSTMARSTPWEDTSGYPRPSALYSPLYVSPSQDRYAETADCWKEGVEKTLENPPEESDAATSGSVPDVAPTEVKLFL